MVDFRSKKLKIPMFLKMTQNISALRIYLCNKTIYFKMLVRTLLFSADEILPICVCKNIAPHKYN